MSEGVCSVGKAGVGYYDCMIVFGGQRRGLYLPGRFSADVVGVSIQPLQSVLTMTMRRWVGCGGSLVRIAIVGLTQVWASGCVVGQKPGKGETLHLRESSTNASYWLYLPEGYDQRPAKSGDAPKHPLVVTMHGMKPFDDENRQIREWQQEADRYGFVVVAPSLKVPSLFSPLPLKHSDNKNLQKDEQNILSIMDEVYRTVDVDPNRVLATCWSYGGYVAHYMVNRHPERFQTLAVKQSNFNENLLDPSRVSEYRDRKVAVYFTENDFAICRRESRAAAEWYAQNGFDLTYAVFQEKGHERTPSVAAEFFARQLGIAPKTPPEELSQLQVKVIEIPGPRRGSMSKQSQGVSTSRGSPARSFTGSGTDYATRRSKRAALESQPVPADEGVAIPQRRGPEKGD